LNILQFLTKKVYMKALTDPKTRTALAASGRRTSAAKMTHSDEAFDVKIHYTTNPKTLFKNNKKVGQGGFGTVFASKSIVNNSKIAIKRMKHLSSKEKMANFAEVRYMAMCNHPNIVKYEGCYIYKDECWMVMEFLEGGTLSDARRAHEFQESEIAYVAKELLKAIAHIHSRHLVHRDVKSENIMMSVMGDIKLIDFGLCSEVTLIKPGMLGSPYWMPPEMINREPHSYPADIWSLGVSILELANKHPPPTQNKVRAMFITGTVGAPHPLEEPAKWSNDFKDFISKCLEKDPAIRGTAKELLKHSFIKQAAHTRSVMRKILSGIFLQKALGLA